jgi:hypothetical protein
MHILSCVVPRGTHYCRVARDNVDSNLARGTYTWPVCRESKPRPLALRSNTSHPFTHILTTAHAADFGYLIRLAVRCKRLKMGLRPTTEELLACISVSTGFAFLEWAVVRRQILNHGSQMAGSDCECCGQLSLLSMTNVCVRSCHRVLVALFFGKKCYDVSKNGWRMWRLFLWRTLWNYIFLTCSQ